MLSLSGTSRLVHVWWKWQVYLFKASLTTGIAYYNFYTLYMNWLPRALFKKWKKLAEFFWRGDITWNLSDLTYNYMSNRHHTNRSFEKKIFLIFHTNVCIILRNLCPVLLQHFPMYRPSDSECTGPDEAPINIKYKAFREKMDCLSKKSTEKVWLSFSFWTLLLDLWTV